MLTEPSNKRAPAYRELADRLRDVILKNGFRQDQRLPTDAELSLKYGLSRDTVRRAYEELVSQGVVRRIQRRGTFATPPGQYVRSFGSIDHLMVQTIDTELETVQQLTPRQASESIANLLGTKRVMEMKVRRLRKGVPFCYSVVTMPLEIGQRLARLNAFRQLKQRRDTTIFELLDRVLESPITVAKQAISVVDSRPDVAKAIECRPGQSVMKIERVFCDGDGNAVELSVTYYNPKRFEYRMELNRTGA